MDEIALMRKFQKLLDDLQLLDPDMRKFVLDWLRARLNGIPETNER